MPLLPKPVTSLGNKQALSASELAWTALNVGIAASFTGEERIPAGSEGRGVFGARIVPPVWRDEADTGARTDVPSSPSMDPMLLASTITWVGLGSEERLCFDFS
mmetsp:Transcript_9714/g.26829  ORF Transcript_9714/g.26829 Transcript_9714/m.26829 type:complete len:104 (-) Transcript_9714:329-640(-)